MFILYLLLSALLLLTLRLLYILPSINPTTPTRRAPNAPPAHLMILLGSGGHTGEMLLLLASLRHLDRYRRTYVFTSGDTLSASKAAEFETKLAAARVAAKAKHRCSKSSPEKEKEACEACTTTTVYRCGYGIESIPRARRVLQNWLTVPLDAVRCFLGCLQCFWRSGVPDVVVTNGPGSAVLMVMVVVGLRFLGIAETRTIYVESFARVKRLSLSGRLLYWVVDRFLVQWPGLREKWPRAEYRGVLVL